MNTNATLYALLLLVFALAALVSLPSAKRPAPSCVAPRSVGHGWRAC